VERHGSVTPHGGDNLALGAECPCTALVLTAKGGPVKTRIETRSAVMLSAVALFAFGIGMSSGVAAQQRTKVVYQVSAAETKYTQQHSIAVGDVPGHDIRIYEIQRTLKEGPMIEGVRAKETWSRGYSDYVEMNGTSMTYGVMVMENGDKIFTHNDLVSQSTEKNPDGSFKSAATVTGRLTGGTGKFLGIRGISRTKVVSDIKAGTNAQQTELEYWMEK
jgi:hypothetical protein